MNASDISQISAVLANITLPNGTIDQLTLVNQSENVGKWNTSYTIPSLNGRYNITIIANDSLNNLNTSETSWFNTLQIGLTNCSDLTEAGATYVLLNNIITLEMQSQAFVNTFVQTIGDINVEMWIGKKDYLLYQAKIDKTIDLSKAVPGVNTVLGVKITLNNSDFNKPIIIQEPVFEEGSVQKLEDVMSPRIKMQKVNLDLGQIREIALFLFNTNNNYSSLCTKGLFPWSSLFCP